MSRTADDDVEICGELHYTPQEVADILKISRDTVIRNFRREPGVIEIGTNETLHKRQRKFLRIPASVLKRFHENHRALKPSSVLKPTSTRPRSRDS